MTSTVESPDLLEAIIASTRRIVSVRSAEIPLEEMERRAAAVEVRAGHFRQALTRSGRINVIAECKRRSPSRGVLRRDYDAASIASGYEHAGAAAISVLTEPAFFDGCLDHLVAVRRATRRARSPKGLHRRSVPDSGSARRGCRCDSSDRRWSQPGIADESASDGDRSRAGRAG